MDSSGRPSSSSTLILNEPNHVPLDPVVSAIQISGVAKEERMKLGVESNMKAGIEYSWVPGGSFPALATWEKYNSRPSR